MTHSNRKVINFMYFGNNYPHDFIEKCWNYDKRLADHLRDKFSDFYLRYTTYTFFRWFMELDEGNKIHLLEWITHNYIAFDNLKQD